MLKFFRKYQKIILVVGGCLLMVVFLLPQLPEMLGGGRNRVLATMGEAKVRYADHQEAQRDLSLLQSIHPLLAARVASELGPEGYDTPSADLWIMRTEEARRNGLIGGPQDGAGFIEETATLLGSTNQSFNFFFQQEIERQRGSEGMGAIDYQDAQEKALEASIAFQRDSMNTGYEALVARYGEEIPNRALSKARGIMRLQTLYGGTYTISLPEARLFGTHLYDSVTANGAVIPASEAGPQPEDYTAQQVQAHFDKYATVDASEDEFGIGYLIKPSVKVEWLKVERSAIQNRVPVDDIELRKLFLENEDAYEGDFKANRLQLRQLYVKDETDRIMTALVKAIRTAIHRDEAVSDQDGWRGIPLSDLADTAEAMLQNDYGIANARPRVFISDGLWKDQEALRSIGGAAGGLGSAFLPQGSGRLAFADIAMNTQELGDIANARLGVQQGHVFQPLQDFQGNQYFFRIIDARPEGPPSSVAEVEDQVREDLAMLEGYEMLAARTDEIHGNIVRDGLVDGLASEAGVRPVTDATIRRRSADLGLNYEIVRNAVMDHVMHWDPLVELSDIPVGERTLVMPVPEARGLVAVQIEKRIPMTLEQFRMGLEGQSSINRARLSEMAASITASAFSYEKMAERLQFERVGGDDEEEDY